MSPRAEDSISRPVQHDRAPLAPLATGALVQTPQPEAKALHEVCLNELAPPARQPIQTSVGRERVAAFGDGRPGGGHWVKAGAGELCSDDAAHSAAWLTMARRDQAAHSTT